MHELCISNTICSALFDIDYVLISHRYFNPINHDCIAHSVFQRLVCVVSDGEGKVSGIGAHSQANN